MAVTLESRKTHEAPETPAFDIDRIRAEFPILSREVHGKPLVYLDSAASAQRPQSVIDAVGDFYGRYNANVHRGVHQLSVEASEAFEQARSTVRRHLNAESDREIVFTRGTTEAVNLVAQSYLRPKLEPGDEILITHLEHHANIVPWQLLCQRTGARLLACDITENGDIDLDSFRRLLSERTALVAVGHVSNALGSVNPVAQITREAHDAGALVLLDGAQAVLHFDVDVQALD